MTNMATRAPFTQVFVADLETDAVSACGQRLKALGAPVETMLGSADETVDRALQQIKPQGLHLAYLDPFNIGQLPFGVIEKLARYKNIDIVVHFSVMDLNRNVELDFISDASRFDAFAPGWRVYVDVSSMTLADARQAFVRYWLSRVAKLGFKCSRERPLMTNSKGGPLYRMLFLLRHPLAEKIWDDVAKGPQGELF
jgi:three-Cys-motif partner protein